MRLRRGRAVGLLDALQAALAVAAQRDINTSWTCPGLGVE
jgi:hypothetical protein